MSALVAIRVGTYGVGKDMDKSNIQWMDGMEAYDLDTKCLFGCITDFEYFDLT